MNNLSEIKCESCKPGAPLVTQKEIKEYMPLIPDWEIVEEEGVRKLKREYLTGDYHATMKLVNFIAELANEEDHHPLMVVEYSSLTVLWWSHKIKGLHLNDFIMAAKSDAAFLRM
jgi:4a-hydroxytetrahydrobiopterin dehydratase